MADHVALSHLTKASKAFWSYSAELMEQWNDELTITRDYIRDNEVYILVNHKQIVGYYAYLKLSKVTVKLDNLFVLPEYIGQGMGKILMIDFLKKGKREGFSKVEVYADPNAEGFYARFGFVVIGKKQTIIAGRYLPVMEKQLF